MSGDEASEGPWGLRSAWRVVTLVGVALLGAAVLVALVLSLGEANRQRDRALSLQRHSYDVMILSRTLAGTIARAEASLGRFVISADDQMVQLYVDEWRQAGAEIDRLDQLTADDPDQRARVDRLRGAYANRGGELSLIALSTHYKKNNQALARYYQARKAAALLQINRTLDEIIARERTLLDQRTAEALASVERSTWAAGVLAVFGVGIVLAAIGLGAVIVSATAERATAQADAEAERERAETLAVAVTEATDALRAQDARLRQVQKMEAVGQLTGGIAHDFNNMLAVVIGGLELARRSAAKGKDDVLRHLESATEGANRAAALTRRLLAFAREEAINPEPIEVAGLLAGMRDLLDRTLGDGVVVQVADRSHGWCVRADRVQLENTVLNLAVNARDAMDGRGTLTVTAGARTLADGEQGTLPAGDYVTVAVADTGCGIAPEMIERVFEPFFTTKPVGKGTGLGLSQIFAFTRQFGGEVAIASEVGRGTTVSLFLPRDHGEQAAAPAGEQPRLVDAERMTRLLALVVEDDPRVLAATVGALEELGHSALPCPDPLAAAELLDKHPNIDLIVSDVIMPGRTGPEMVAALPERHAHVAVLFVTGFAGEGGEFGGRPVLRKPYTLAALERAVADAMRAERPAPPASLAAE